MFSGGISSFEATKVILNKYTNNTRIWFFDTLIEDQDTFRFINDCEHFFQRKIEVFTEGRNPWQVFRDERFIGNSYKTPCNKILKRKLLEKLLRNYRIDDVTLVFGISFEEKHRIYRISEGWRRIGVKTVFPLINGIIGEDLNYKSFLKKYGFEPPRLYKLGFKHNNCGGACVKAGIKQWVHLLNQFPERYLWHEREENITREFLHKDVSILRDRNGGITKPLTLESLRRRVESS